MRGSFISVGSNLAGTVCVSHHWENRRAKRHTPTYDSAVVTREPRARRIGRSSAPEVISRVGEIVGLGFVKEARLSTILLRQDDLIEQFDTWVI